MKTREPYGVLPLLEDLAHIATAAMVLVNAIGWPLLLALVLR